MLGEPKILPGWHSLTFLGPNVKSRHRFMRMTAKCCHGLVEPIQLQYGHVNADGPSKRRTSYSEGNTGNMYTPGKA
jgi:hypothetical protein